MSEYHVASFIVRCRRKYLNSIVDNIEKLHGAEVHDQDPMGKIIVTAEGETHRTISNLTEQIRDMAHVVDVAAVYHEYAPEGSAPDDATFEGKTK
jgi:nitrate reductase NapD